MNLTHAFWRHSRRNGAMPSVQIKDVPDEVHTVLRQRAAAAHQSLQENLRSWLIEETSRPTLDETLDRRAWPLINSTKRCPWCTNHTVDHRKSG